MISNKQKNAVEKITGKSWDLFSPDVVEEYFAFTDRGILPHINNSLIVDHRHHAITVEMWKRDFKSGLLFLWDFLKPEYPKAYIEHAFDVYESVFGYIPKCYREHPLSPMGFSVR